MLHVRARRTGVVIAVLLLAVALAVAWWFAG
jgi:hypothetical protein